MDAYEKCQIPNPSHNSSADLSTAKDEGGSEIPTASYPHTNGIVDDDLHVPCPPHTTDRRLVNKIDWHVIPFLCIMYLLAFLDR
jgi:hypothetical protein